MPFYNYGQNIGGLSDVVDNAEQGFTFAQGVKSAIQKRRIDSQKAADEHTTSQVDDQYKMKEGGFAPADMNPGAPTREGSLVAPNDSGISNPVPKPGLFSRIGHALAHPFGIGDQQGGEQHTATGQNAGTHTTAPFVDTGKMMQERISDASNAAASQRNLDSEFHADYRNDQTQQGEDRREQEREGADMWRTLTTERGRTADRGAQMADANRTRTMGVLQRYIAAKQARLNGLGGLMITDQEKAQLQKEIQAGTAEMARQGGINPRALQGGYDDPDAIPQTPGMQGYTPPGTVNPNDPYQGYPPAIFGGKHPPATDQNYMAWLKANVPLPQR